MQHLILLSITLFCLTFSTGVKAAVKIKILGSSANQLPFTILPFKGANTSIKPENIITNDLVKSGHFRYVDLGDATIGRSISTVNYRFYRSVGVENLITGKVSKVDDKTSAIEVSLLDTLLEKKIWTYRWTFSSDSTKYSSHLVSDLVFKTIIGKPISFTSRIAYVHVDFLAKKKRIYSILYAESDVSNVKSLISSSMPLLSPAWSPDGKRIAYVSYERGRPEIFIHNIYTGKRFIIADFTGSNSSPAWSPDGHKLLMSLSLKNNSNIYEIDIQTKKLRQLTRHPGIDTEPVYRSHGRSFLFTSNRLGKPTIFEYFFSRKEILLLSKKIDNGYSASISSDNSKIALLSSSNGNFNITLYNKNLDEIDLLTNSPLNDSPTLSPHGNFVMFSQVDANKNRSTVYLLDTLTRTRSTLIRVKGEIKDIAWGPPAENLSSFK